MGTFEDILEKGAAAVKDSWFANSGWYILVGLAITCVLSAVYNQYQRCKTSCKLLYCIFTLDGTLIPVAVVVDQIHQLRVHAGRPSTLD